MGPGADPAGGVGRRASNRRGARATWPRRRRSWRSCTPPGPVGVPSSIELGVDPDELRAPERHAGPVYALEPGFTFWRERLQFLVWANAYDARDGDPGVVARSQGVPGGWPRKG